MGRLSSAKIQEIEEYLAKGGLTFSPLKEELLDHVISDMDSRLEEGQDYERAWNEIKKELPTNHLKHIEKETMETFKSKMNLTNILVGISGAALIIGALLKLLHLPGAGIVMIAFLFLTALVLLYESTRSIYVYREKKGALTLIVATLAVIAHIASICFKIMHLPGATLLMYGSVISVATIFPLMSVYFYFSRQKLRDHLLILLVERNQKVLETTSTLLVGFGLLFYYSSGLEGTTRYLGIMFLVFTVIIIGLSVYVRSWSYYVKTDEEGNKGVGLLLLVSSATAMVMFILPVLGRELDLVARNLLAYGAFVIFTIILIVHYRRFSASPNRRFLAALSSFLLFFPFFRVGVNLGWLEGWLVQFTTDYYLIQAQVVFLCVLLIVFRKEPLFKALAIMTIASSLIPIG